MYLIAGQVQRGFLHLDPHTPICESCWHPLEEREDDDGIYLVCLNEMCLDETQYYHNGQVRYEDDNATY